MPAVFLCSFVVGVVFYFLRFLFRLGGGAKQFLSPFECGFEAVGRARTPFSLQFFLLGILFIIFDVEVVLLLPFIR